MSNLLDINTGITALTIQVVWLGCHGLEKPPPILPSMPWRKSMIHCGGNYLRDIKSVKLVAGIKQDLRDLHRQFPEMKIILSAITQRYRWRSACPKKMDKAWCFINSVMANFVPSIGGSIVHHHQIKHRDPGHFLHDGVHFTPQGNFFSLNNSAQCLKHQIQ